MIKVCAWCGKGLESEGGSTITPVSHGICPDCSDNMEHQLGVSLQSYIDGLKVPILVVTGDAVIQSANKYGEAILGKSVHEMHGLPGGDVFECAYARWPEGCGRTIHCSGCTIRRSVMKTFETGTPVFKQPAILKRWTGQDTRDLAYLITTIKQGDAVLLQVEPAGDQAALFYRIEPV